MKRINLEQWASFLVQSYINNLYIAYSGGIDSHVLLHLNASDERLKKKLTAVYINHGLQKEAEAWCKHCESVCNNLGIKFLSLAVNATAELGESPEEAARNARYEALKPLLGKDDVLLLAQHAEDQLETVLLQLFRGSGLKGLSGMPESMAFGQGKLVRPLLDVSKNAIIDYAEANQLEWIEDPSNQYTHFDRNFLRNDILPLLKQRWPSLDKTVSRSAKHCSNAQALIDTLSGDLLTAVIHPSDNTLNLSRLKDYPLLQQQLIIRQWFQHLGLKMPSQNFVQKVLDEVVAARDDANPVLTTQGYCFRRYRNTLYCLKPTQNRLGDELIWPSDDRLLQIVDDVTYEVVDSSSGISAELWRNARITVRFRSGGESIELPNRSGHHPLKKLYQEAGVPTWERARMPLIYLDDTLAAVGEHWISNEFYSLKKEPCLRIIRHKINPKGNDGTPDVD
ncbi:tRNA lysidine(34) synthetase TilS [Methyloglobulus sp.]|uniref:tRNA lysidine(34) synthetase TilS n=1 Tax=Methyloglobulus sp. TaxID=2518622 RepID=UPI0032B6FA3A